MPLHERIPYDGCPLCEHDKAELVREVNCSYGKGPELPLRREVKWVKCCECGHVYTSGYWGDEALQCLWDLRPEICESLDVERRKWAGIVEKVRRHTALSTDDAGVIGYRTEEGRKAARWLDIGCGVPVGISVAAEYGFDAMGIDVREQVVDLGKRWGLDVRQADFGSDTCMSGAMEMGEADDPRTFDVIVLSEFLEHQAFPIEAIKKASVYLRPGGVVYASTPSRTALPWIARDAAYHGGPQLQNVSNIEQWVQIEHFHAFDREHLETVFRKGGLEPVAFHVGERYFETIEVIGR